MNTSIRRSAGYDEAVHDRGALAAAIGTREQPGLAPERDAAQRALGGVVAEADAAVIEAAGEGGPALEDVVHGLGQVVPARKLGALLGHPDLQVVEQRRAELAAHGQPLSGAVAVDRPLDLEQGVDGADHLQRDRRDDGGRLAPGLAPGVLGEVGHDEERSAGMDPAGGFLHGTGHAAGFIELAVTLIGVGLQDGAIAGQMRLRMGLAHVGDDLPLAGDHLQCLGDVLAQLGEPCPAAAGAGRGAGHDDPLARQVLGERLAGRTLARERRHAGGLGRRQLGGELVLRGRGFQLLELQLQLIEQTPCALRARSVSIPLELLDLQLQMGDQGLVVGGLGPGPSELGTRREQRRLERFNVVGKGVEASVHRGMES